MIQDIEKEYNTLCKKFKLPKFKDLDVEFEISTLENHGFLLRNILRKIEEKLEFYIDTINNLLQPDMASLVSLHELRFFTDDEKNDIYRIFKILVKTSRNIIELVLEHDEKNQADFLNKFFDQWLGIKIELINYIGKMKDSWEKETSIKEDLGYFG